MKQPKRISLANIPTPLIHTKFRGNKFLLKRDDFTGMELSGNKVRKLEFLLYDAKKKNADYIFTCGGDQSNHARATAIAATSLGFKTKLFLWGNENQKPDGNLFLDKLTNTEIVFLNKKQYENVTEIMDEEKLALNGKGKKVYVIGTGGSSTLGIWGYINFVFELSKQINLNKIKGIILAAGSGGTASGILVGAALLGYKFKVFSVTVIDNKETISNKILELTNNCIKEFKLNIKIKPINLEIIDGYSEEGYKFITQDKVRILKEFMLKNGILFDPVYTGKAFVAFNDIFLTGADSNKYIFLHTGGMFGTFAKKKDFLLDE